MKLQEPRAYGRGIKIIFKKTKFCIIEIWNRSVFENDSTFEKC